MLELYRWRRYGASGTLPSVNALLSDVLPPGAVPLAAALIAAGLVVGFIGVSALLFIWAERKISARIQDRLGPTRTGKFGLLQSLADGIKLITKEDLIPTAADPVLYRLAPYLAFCAAFCGYIALPFGAGVAPQLLNVAAFFLLAALASEVFGVLLAGYASGNKWALFGGVREAAQVVSYEIPRGLCVLVPVAIAGTLDLTRHSQLQAGFFWNWTLFHDPFTAAAFVIFFIVATASCKRAPFDLAEAESELVAGFHTEYSGIRWSYFFMAEYGSMFAMSGLAVLLFLGGWHTGLLPFEPTEEFGYWLGNFVNVPVFIAKGSLLVGVMMWVRWTLPRLRIDQVMTACLKYFLPLSCAVLVLACTWQLLVPPEVAAVVRYTLAGASVLGGLLFAFSLLKPLPGETGTGPLPGAWHRSAELPPAQPAEPAGAAP
jgi:NADH-quinone oxidoreductase subunit H